jgi:hypothetical protein
VPILEVLLFIPILLGAILVLGLTAIGILAIISSALDAFTGLRRRRDRREAQRNGNVAYLWKDHRK